MKKSILMSLVLAGTTLIIIRSCHHYPSQKVPTPKESLATISSTPKPTNEKKLQKENLEIDIYNPLNWHEHAEEIQTRLRNQEVKTAVPMSEYLASIGRRASYGSVVWKIVLNDGTEAVFKILEDGQKASSYSMEEAVFNFTIATKLAFAPPIVFRAIHLPGTSQAKYGFLSLFVKTDVDAHALSFADFANWVDAVPEPDRSNYKIFNFVFGNWDLAQDNIMLLNYGARHFLIAIDNEGLCQKPKVRKYGELMFARKKKLQTHTPTTDTFPFEQSKPCDATERKKIQEKYNYKPSKWGHNYVIWNGFYWQQHTSDEQYIFLTFAKILPESAKLALKELTKEKIWEIMLKTHSKNDFIAEIVDGIYGRRNMVLEYFGEL